MLLELNILLNQQGFSEINTPILENTTGGADANPFVTHMDALDQDFYLRISHELPLKRLLGGGYNKIYDIGPRFRNENYSYSVFVVSLFVRRLVRFVCY